MGALGPDSKLGISEAKEEKAKALPLELPKGVGKLTQKKQPFFVRYMIRQVLENANGQFNALGRSVKARKRTLFEGGLQITTTFDPAWQAFAQQAANQPYRISIPSHGKARPDPSIVTVDTRSGAIRTLLSGKSFMRDELALATDPHPTGSAFKPFVLAAAFEQGIPPTQSYSSSSPFCSPLWNDDDHCVSNAEGSGHGTVDLWTATEDSINVVFAQLILDIGPETVPPVATKMGVSNELPPVASLATGSAEVSPLDMAVGFAMLATGGVRCNPYTVETIVRDGDDLYQHEPDCERAVRPDIAHQITAMLERVPVSGTAAGAFSEGWVPGRSPARRARPTSTRPSGSADTRNSSRRRSGWDRTGQPLQAPQHLGLRRHGRGADLAELHDPGRCKASPRWDSPNRLPRRPAPFPTWSGSREARPSPASPTPGSTPRPCRSTPWSPKASWRRRVLRAAPRSRWAPRSGSR